jgi:hypothetical protein
VQFGQQNYFQHEPQQIHRGKRIRFGDWKNAIPAAILGLGLVTSIDTLGKKVFESGGQKGSV